MEKKVNISLPKGKKAKNVKFKFSNGKIEVTYDLDEKFEPKDGDFLISNQGNIFIYNGKHSRISYGAYAGVRTSQNIVLGMSDNGWTLKNGVRFATPEEKSAFLKRLEKEAHKQWNPNKKCLEDVYVPKFGDIVKVIDIPKYKRDYMICIYPKREEPWDVSYIQGFFNIANLDLDGRLSFECGNKNDGELRIIPASESEKQELFDKLAEVGKRWNPDTKQLEDIRWEPKYGEYYFYVNTCGGVSKSIYNTAHDRCMIEIGNAFETEEAAKPYADQIKEIFKNSKAE